MIMHQTHDLSSPTDLGEIREYRRFPNGVICLHITRSNREGVYCYRDGQWEYDGQISSEFAWDRPYGELCAVLPQPVTEWIRLDAFLSYTERMLLDPDSFLQQGWDQIWTQYITPAMILMENIKENPEIRTAALEDVFRAAESKGQEYFSSCWRDGTVKSIIDKIKKSLPPEKLDFVPAKNRTSAEKTDIHKADQALAGQDNQESFEKCLSYFSPKRGLANDFIFPGKLLEELSAANRQKIENMIIYQCLQAGDKRFFDALIYCKMSNLNAIFTGQAMQQIKTPEVRAQLLRVLYQSTGNQTYLEQMIRMAPGHELTYYYVCGLIEDIQGSEDYLEAIRKENRYQLIWHAVKTIAEIRHASGWYKHNPLQEKWGKKECQAIAQLSMPELKNLIEKDEWYFEGLDELMTFYQTLAWSYEYQSSRNQKKLQDILHAALLYPEAYDVLRYIKEQKIITQEEIKTALREEQAGSQSNASYIPYGEVFRVIEIRQEGNGVSDFHAFEDTREMVAAATWPQWKGGYEHEEADLAEYYCDILKQCRERGAAFVLFPCGDHDLRGVTDSNGILDFPKKRTAEIALHTAYQEVLNHLDQWKSGKICFLCSSGNEFQIYINTLKELIIDQAIRTASPESEKLFYSSSAGMFLRLGILQWHDPSCYNNYVDRFINQNDKPTHYTNDPEKPTHYTNDTQKTSDYARSMSRWDYDTCLAYLIFLQRLDYWSGGMESPLYAQIANGTVRRVLLRMKSLLQEQSL